MREKNTDEKGKNTRRTGFYDVDRGDKHIFMRWTKIMQHESFFFVRSQKSDMRKILCSKRVLMRQLLFDDPLFDTCTIVPHCLVWCQLELSDFYK